MMGQRSCYSLLSEHPGCFDHLSSVLYSLKIFSQEIFELPFLGKFKGLTRGGAEVAMDDRGHGGGSK